MQELEHIGQEEEQKFEHTEEEWLLEEDGYGEEDVMNDFGDTDIIDTGVVKTKLEVVADVKDGQVNIHIDIHEQLEDIEVKVLVIIIIVETLTMNVLFGVILLIDERDGNIVGQRLVSQGVVGDLSEEKIIILNVMD